MDLSGYQDQGENRKQPPTAIPVKRFKFSEAPKEQPSYVTKEQVYAILKNHYRSDQASSADIGEENRKLLSDQYFRRREAEDLAQQAKARGAQVS